ERSRGPRGGVGRGPERCAADHAGRSHTPRWRHRAQTIRFGRGDGAPHARADRARGARRLHSPLAVLLQHERRSDARAGRHGGGGRLMRPALLLLMLALGGPAAAAAQRGGDSTWLDHDRAADNAYKAGDFSTFRAQLLSMRREIGPLPSIDYDLAVAEARLGNGDRALEWLEIF